MFLVIWVALWQGNCSWSLRKVNFMVSLRSYRIQLSSAPCNYEFSENGSICFLKVNALYLVHAMFGGRGFRGFVLIATGKMEILTTFPHFQDEKEVIRRYEGWYYTRLSHII